jgi:ferredoxin
MRIRIDGDLCQGHGRCYTLSPDLLESDDEGYVTLKGSDMEVPPGMEAAARRAANAGPEDAIRLTDS